MPIADANGIRLYYEVQGEGRPLLVILGLAADVSEFSPLLADLAHTRQVITLDNRGSGRSDKPDEPYSIEVMAADALGVMDAVPVERADVLGISLGGRIALELALRHPERVERLVLVSTSARVDPRRRRRRRLWSFVSGLPILRSRHPQPRYAFLRQFDASAGHDATARLGDLVSPTLILHGKSDSTVPLALAEEMRSRIPGARMVTFPGGHLFFLLRARRLFLTAVENFLE